MGVEKHYIVTSLVFLCCSFVCICFENNLPTIEPNSSVWCSVSEVAFPLIFGYFLDFFGRKNCLAMLTLSIIIPGFAISFFGNQSSIFNNDCERSPFILIGILFLQSGLQSINVVIITSLFLKSNNIFLYPMLNAGLKAAQSALSFYSGINDIYRSWWVVVVLFGVMLVSIWALWYLEQQTAPTVSDRQIKPYLLNVYFCFALVQGLNYCIGDLSVKAALKTFHSKDSTEYNFAISMVQTLGYSITLGLLIFMSRIQNLVIITQTFLADLVMSFGILILKVGSIMKPSGSEGIQSEDLNKIYTQGLACIIITVASYVFCTSSYMICLRSYKNKGIAVGTVLSINRLIRLLTDSAGARDQDPLQSLIWAAIGVLVLEKIALLLIGFYDSHRFQLLFTAQNQFNSFQKASVMQSFT